MLGIGLWLALGISPIAVTDLGSGDSKAEKQTFSHPNI